jgi:hypothetical protein
MAAAAATAAAAHYFALGMKPYTYTVYTTVGKLSSIRATFYKLRNTPGIMPPSKSRSGESLEPLNPAFFLAAGQPDLGRNFIAGRALNTSQMSYVDSRDTSSAGGGGPSGAGGALGTTGGQGSSSSSGSSSSGSSSSSGGGGSSGGSFGHGARRTTAGALAGVLSAAGLAGAAVLAAVGLREVKRRKSAEEAQALAAAAARHQDAAVADANGDVMRTPAAAATPGGFGEGSTPTAGCTADDEADLTASVTVTAAAAAASSSSAAAAAKEAVSTGSPGVTTRAAARLAAARTSKS